MATAGNSRICRSILLTITIFSLSLPAYAKYSGGTGEPNDPYQIATHEDLMLLGETPEDYDKHFILTADIDLDPNLPGRKVFDKAFIASFSGAFDGKGYTISHLTINGVLFGWLESGAEVRDLGVVYVNITGTGDYIGGIVGSSSGAVTNCYCTGVVVGDRYVGGLMGYNGSGVITHCYSTCVVSGRWYVGGLVGNNAGDVTQCYSRGTVNGRYYVGGLVASNSGSVTECYSVGLINGIGPAFGGLVGVNQGIVTASFWDTQVSSRTRSEGGTNKTTSQMHDIRTYLDAQWDFVGEFASGTHEVWQMPEGGGYPVLAMLSGYAPTQLQGSGTPEDPYLISDVLDLGAMVYYSPYSHYRLAASIDLSGIRWAAAVIPWFAGTFDGNNLTISHLTITGGSYLGMFGHLESGGEVRDLGVVDVNIAGSYYVGGLVGINYSDNLSNCYSTGAVSGESDVGGFVGKNGGETANCYSTSTVSGGSSVGGLVGANWVRREGGAGDSLSKWTALSPSATAPVRSVAYTPSEASWAQMAVRLSTATAPVQSVEIVLSVDWSARIWYTTTRRLSQLLLRALLPNATASALSAAMTLSAG